MRFVNKIVFVCLFAVPMCLKAQNLTTNKDSINRIRTTIARDILGPALRDKSQIPNWEQVLSTAKEHYGTVGEEKVYGSQMIYYYDKKDWANFGKYYALYYKTAYSRSEYHINNLSWPIFAHISDTAILAVAVQTMKYSIEHFDQNNFQAYDTYANLLYKAGFKEQAIEWQEKAVKALPADKGLAETLENMKKGIPTWN